MVLNCIFSTFGSFALYMYIFCSIHSVHNLYIYITERTSDRIYLLICSFGAVWMWMKLQLQLDGMAEMDALSVRSKCFISRLCWMFDGRMTDWLTDISYKIQHFSLYVVTWNWWIFVFFFCVFFFSSIHFGANSVLHISVESEFMNNGHH